MKRRLIQALGVVGATTIVLGGVFATAASGESAVSMEEMLPTLYTAQSATDHVPAGTNLAELGNIDPKSTRFLASNGVGSFWVARSGSSVCMIVRIIGSGDVAAASCTSASKFYSYGLSLAAGEGPDHPDRSAEAYLVPTGISPAVLAAKAGLKASSSSTNQLLVVDRPRDSVRPGLVSVPRKGGGEFAFVPLRLRGDGTP
ncbi:conserved exported hypothetical protein [Nostocoides japonicum T1-X7]|uniref:Uncharacterized protein n=1 Tax=Nostocoides japonicum T1-X7 TaxID=1194083 RepID=A0A077LVG0_9MICO|nr:hypothetical protein [Tetrasphaera japonica]CCH75994.1 conserved exported hypothetical protein [Tetrasphaera japonica T1-X7]